MPAERREWAIVFEIGSTGNGRNPVINGRRQPSRGGTSRMNREVQVRICERFGVKFPGPTRPPRRITASEGSDAIGAKRTCRDRRERVELTKMTRNGHQLDPNRALHNILTRLWALGMLPSCRLVVTRCNSIK